ncbi:hypothetical protein [Clostridium sp. Marseille-P2415]|uniref:hypothetical protein n=1 Tax=Clostridium sp. Marseille-P2415 TaxID=1805471 RepID=UPI0009884BBE|nr:hypothetical protein [Clostridium sp. Marseille-P2415]
MIKNKASFMTALNKPRKAPGYGMFAYTLPYRELFYYPMKNKKQEGTYSGLFSGTLIIVQTAETVQEIIFLEETY